MNLMVLAAGLGTRLRPYTDTLPKPAIPFLRVPLAQYGLALFDWQNINNLVVNTHHLPEKVEQVFRALPWPSEKLIFSHEPKILGSGGGIRQALPSLLGQGHFAVINGDEVLFPSTIGLMEEAFAFHRWHKGIATLIALDHPEVGHRFGGMWLEGSGSKISKFSKTAIAGHRGLHFPGILILRDDVRRYFSTNPQQEENILYETLTRAMQAGEDVHAFQTEAQWFETGNQVDFLAAARTCTEALNAANPPAWTALLRQVLRRYGNADLWLEKAEPALADAITKSWPHWLSEKNP
jgi:mannose-1-phosphate guanylyltransferase